MTDRWMPVILSTAATAFAVATVHVTGSKLLFVTCVCMLVVLIVTAMPRPPSSHVEVVQSGSVPEQKGAAVAKSRPIPRLIRCADHKMAPWVLVCVHIVERPGSVKWTEVPVGEGSETPCDFICVACAERYEELQRAGDDLKMLPLLKPVCIHCLRELKRRAGLEEANNE